MSQMKRSLMHNLQIDMSNIFSKLSYFPATCVFCRSEGMTIGAYTDSGKEVAVCVACSDKLVLGISTALDEIKKIEDEKKAKEDENVVKKDNKDEKIDNLTSIK